MLDNKFLKKHMKLEVMIFIIAILGVAVYSNSLNGAFIWDDEFLVENNTYIRSPDNIGNLFTKNIGAGAGRIFKPYRPFQMLTYMMDYFLWGLDVKGYHITNTLLHILVALTIYWLITILYSDRLLSFLTSTLFLVHPIHTEAVSYISGRADSLAALFMLLCLIFYIKYLHNENKNFFYCFMTVSYIFAVFSRESSLILPFLVLLYHYAFRKKIKMKPFSTIICITFLFVFLRHMVLRSLVFPAFVSSTLLQRIPGIFVALSSYLRLLLVPSHLHLGYGDKLWSLFCPQAITGIIIFFLSVFLLIYAYRKRGVNNLVFFAVSWFFLTLLPQSNIYPISAYMAEHWLYLPSIGFFLLIAQLLVSLFRAKRGKFISVICMVTLVAFYANTTIKQNNYWKDPIVFYTTSLKYSPDNPKLYNNLGKLYSDEGKHENAIDVYKKAIEIKPHSTFYYNLGNEYYAVGDAEQAIASYQQAIEIGPNFSDAHYNLGIAYESLGMYEKAIAAFRQAMALNPRDKETQHKLNRIYKIIGR